MYCVSSPIAALHGASKQVPRWKVPADKSGQHREMPLSNQGQPARAERHGVRTGVSGRKLGGSRVLSKAGETSTDCITGTTYENGAACSRLEVHM